MATFNGQLNSNEIFAALYNMIISQQVFADNIASTGSELVDMSRVEGSMYGDTKLYYSTDVLKSTKWGNDAEAANLLALHRPEAPTCQAIRLNVFRQIALTVADYLSKRAWGDEGAFSSFKSVMLGWMGDTKKVYDATTFNAFVGTAKSGVATENVEIDLTTAVGSATGEEAARIEGGVIAEEIAKLITNLKDITRDYNDNGQLRSYNISDLVFVWNSDAVAHIEKRDLPTIYHKDIVDRLGEYVVTARYFGTANAGETQGNGTTVRSLVEQDIGANHYFAGDLIKASDKAPAGTSYTVNPKILFKVMHRQSVPYMSAFEVGTSFFNAKSLTDNRYLTFGHNTLEYLKQYPFVTVTKK